MRALSPTSDGKNGKEGRDRGVSKIQMSILAHLSVW